MKPIISSSEISYRVKTSIAFLTCLLFQLLPSCQKDEYDQKKLNIEGIELYSTLELSPSANTYYGPETFRTVFKQTLLETRDLSNPNFEYFESFVLKVQNGSSKNTKIKKIEIKIDDVLIVSSADFRGNVNFVSKSLSGLTSKSQLKITLEGKTDCFIELLIEGTLKDLTWNTVIIPNSQLLDNTTQPSLYNGTIAWHDGTYNGNLFYWNGLDTRIVANGVFSGPISLFNGKIAFLHNEGSNNGVRIYFWDGNSSINIAPSIWASSGSLYDGKIAFGGAPDGTSALYGIFIWDGLSTTQFNTGGRGGGPSLYRNTIAWVDGGKIFYYNGAETVTIYDSHDSERSFIDKLSLFDGKIAFSAYNGDISAYNPNDWEIFLWDGNKTIQVTDNNYEDKRPSLYDGKIAWQAKLGTNEFSTEIFFWNGYKSYQVTNNLIPDQYPSLFNGNIAWNSGSAWNGFGQISYTVQVK